MASSQTRPPSTRRAEHPGEGALARGAEQALKLINDQQETGLELAVGPHALPLGFGGAVERPRKRVGGRLGAARGHPRPPLGVSLRACRELGQAVGRVEVGRERGQAVGRRHRHYGPPQVDPWHSAGPGELRHEASADQRGLTGAAGADDEQSWEPVRAHGRGQELVAGLLDSELAAEEDGAAVTVVGNETRIRGAPGGDVPNGPARDVPLLLKPADEAVFELGLEVLGGTEVVGGGNIVPGLVAERAGPPLDPAPPFGRVPPRPALP